MAVQMSAHEAFVHGEIPFKFLRPYPVTVAEVKRFVYGPTHQFFLSSPVFDLEDIWDIAFFYLLSICLSDLNDSTFP
jgi:hypothetical protein